MSEAAVASGLTWPVALAVLCAALLHASWNALIKRGSDKALDTALIHGLAVLIAIPAVLVLGLPRAEAWPYLIGSLIVHIGYYVALVGAYQHGDLGLTYPVMRGFAPLLVACGSAAFVGEVLAPGAWAGVAAISIGVVTMGLAGTTAAHPLRHRDPQAHHGKALGYALFNALLIALYTVIDGLGVRKSGDTAAYLAALFMMDGVPYFCIVMWQRRQRLPETFATMGRRWPVALPATLASIGAYGIALWAMTRAPVALVAALRETSVLFAAVIGASWLGEAYGRGRIAATLIIVAGVIGLRLAR